MPLPTQTLTKTEFIDWLACEGRAWVAKHQPDRIPPAPASDQRRRDEGWLLESYARQLFPDGIEIEPLDPVEAAQLTRSTLSSATTLFQPAVISDRGLAARADVLMHEADGWHLIEIKSTAANPATPRDVQRRYLSDVAFQTLAFRDAGVPITRCSILHIRKGYRRDGSIDPDSMFALTDMTLAVDDALPTLEPLVSDALTRLLNPLQPAACTCHLKTRANRCDMFSTFHPEIPPHGTIYSINGIHRETLLAALERGVLAITDWPDDIALSRPMRRQVQIARSNQALIQHDALQSFLAALEPPLWFLDYETFQEAVPRWSGYAPHQQIPFQYSLHVVEQDGRIRDFGYLCTVRDQDPVPDLLERLSRDLGDGGTVIVWNQGFEQARNIEMAALHPGYAPFLETVNARMRDLSHIVTKGWWIDPGFEGSWSLKSVLPVAAPELDYAQLTIGDGATASEHWMQAFIDPTDRMTDDDRQEIAASLLTYCHQDTLAMVRIWHHVLDLITR